MEDVAHLPQKHGHPIAPEHRLDQGAVEFHGAGGHRDVPEAVSLLPDQAENPGCGPFHLGVGGGSLKESKAPPVASGLARAQGEELLLHRLEGRAPLPSPLQHLGIGGNSPLPGQAEELPGGAPGRGKESALSVPLLQGITGEGHRHRPGLPEQDGEHLALLGGEVGKAVQIEVLSLGPAAPLQGGDQPGEAVPGVGPLLLGEGLIGPEDQGDVPELVPLAPAGLLPGLPEGLGRDAAALELIHRGEEPRQKGRLAGGPAVDREFVGNLPQGGIHEQEPSPRVQRRGGHSSVDRKDPPGQPGEGEDLRIAGDLVPRGGAQPALAVVGVLFRHDEDLGALPPALPNAPEELAGGRASSPAQQQMQHTGPPPSAGRPLAAPPDCQ